jgi:hypothetical protein
VCHPDQTANSAARDGSQTAAPDGRRAAPLLPPPPQVFHVCTSPVVQAAWAEGQELHVWGVIYDLADGLIRRMAGPFSAESEVDETLVGGLGWGAVLICVCWGVYACM